MARFHEVRKPAHPWGDYGAILVHGLVDFDGMRATSLPCIMRADSWVPEIALPLGLMYVTERVKDAIVTAEFNNIQCRPVTVTRAIKIGWREWDLTSEFPRVFPAGGEPENYLLRRKHNEAVCREIPPLWSVEGSPIVGTFKDWANQWSNGNSSAPDFASLSGLSHYVSPRLKSLLLSVAADFVEFVD
jgi:hypothetical protein